MKNQFLVQLFRFICVQRRLLNTWIQCFLVMVVILLVSVGSAITGIRATRRAVAARKAQEDPRGELVDLRLARLEPAVR